MWELVLGAQFLVLLAIFCRDAGFICLPVATVYLNEYPDQETTTNVEILVNNLISYVIRIAVRSETLIMNRMFLKEYVNCWAFCKQGLHPTSPIGRDDGTNFRNESWSVKTRMIETTSFCGFCWLIALTLMKPPVNICRDERKTILQLRTTTCVSQNTCYDEY